MKKIIILLMSLVICGCSFNVDSNEEKEEIKEKVDYKNLKNLTLDGVNISTMLNISNVNDITEYIESNDKTTYRFVYNDGAIKESDYQKLIQYLYNECYGYDSLLGSLNVDSSIGNYAVFYKKTKTNGKAIQITIEESIKNSKSIYTLSYKLVDFDGEIYYMRYNGIVDGVDNYVTDEACSN